MIMNRKIDRSSSWTQSRSEEAVKGAGGAAEGGRSPLTASAAEAMQARIPLPVFDSRATDEAARRYKIENIYSGSRWPDEQSRSCLSRLPRI